MSVPATWDPSNTNDGAGAFSNGDRTYLAQGSGRWTKGTLGTYTVAKYYFEVERHGACNGTYDWTGVAKAGAANNWRYSCLGHGIADGSGAFSSQGSYGDGGIIGFAVEYTGSLVKLWIRKTDGAWIGGGDPAAGTTPTMTITTTDEIVPYLSGEYLHGGTINCGQEAYAMTPPTGFSDLAIPDIEQYEDLALNLSYIHDHAEDLQTPLQLAALVVEGDLPLSLGMAARALEGDLSLAAHLSKQQLRDLPLDIRLDDGVVRADMATRLSLSDGTARQSLPLRILLARTAPLYKAVIAQRLRSVTDA